MSTTFAPLRAHRLLSPRPAETELCGRCGIPFDSTLKGERGKYCHDCRPYAAQLGWCPPKPRKHRDRTALRSAA
ncbi:hypothetical protein [Zhihengliuella halotolerans]|uniref:hypothetical protein n=1 Tax=Zhihengliuella halotolerans TaxID=370736 RepID=UPI000C8087DE|nr:hypothetical protein [Zhihengliuella halotolerans]